MNLPTPVDSILEAVLTVSPNKQYRGILFPTTPATHGPTDKQLPKMVFNEIRFFILKISSTFDFTHIGYLRK